MSNEEYNRHLYELKEFICSPACGLSQMERIINFLNLVGFYEGDDDDLRINDNLLPSLTLKFAKDNCISIRDFLKIQPGVEFIG